MPTLNSMMDLNLLKEHIENGVISVREHPSLPLRVFNYTPKAQYGNIWDAETVQCRGLISDAEGNIVSRCMPKFFNLGQQGTVIRSQNPAVVEHPVLDLDALSGIGVTPTITRKMDGQCGILYFYGDDAGVSTRGSFSSEGAIFATSYFKNNADVDDVRKVTKGWTLIFEIIAPHLRIVIPYDWEGLCLLTAINNETGEELGYADLRALWLRANDRKQWCTLVEKFDVDVETASKDEDEEEEGYVVSFPVEGLPPIKCKIKLATYCKLHSILTSLNARSVWEFLSERKTAELNKLLKDTSLPAEFRNWLNAVSVELRKRYRALLHEILNEWAMLQVQLRVTYTPEGDEIDMYNSLHRKYFAVEVVKFKHKSYLFSLFEGKEIEQALWKDIYPSGTETFRVDGE